MSSTSPITPATGSARWTRVRLRRRWFSRTAFWPRFWKPNSGCFKTRISAPIMSPRPVTIPSPRLTATTPFLDRARRSSTTPRITPVGVWQPGYTIQTGDDPSGTYPVGTIIPPVGRAFSSVKYTRGRSFLPTAPADTTPQRMPPASLPRTGPCSPPIPVPQYASYPTIHYCHGGRIANVSFADGHVEQARYVKPPVSLWNSYGQQVPAGGIAWFDQQNLSFFGFDNSAYNPSGSPTASK